MKRKTVDYRDNYSLFHVLPYGKIGENSHSAKDSGIGE